MNAKAAGIPVGVIDTGIEQVHEWGLDLWVGGGSEYNNGVRAGEIMGEAGVKTALCVNQEVGNVALDDRCNGFKEGLAKTGGTIEVVAVTMDPTESAGRVEAYLTAQSRHRRRARARAERRRSDPAAAARDRHARQDQDGHVRPVAGGARGGRHGRDALRHRQPAISDGLPAGRLLHHEGDVRDDADRQRDDRPGLHHEGPGRQRARASASRASAELVSAIGAAGSPSAESARPLAANGLADRRLGWPIAARRTRCAPSLAADAAAAAAGARRARRHAARHPRSSPPSPATPASSPRAASSTSCRSPPSSASWRPPSRC